MAAPTPRASLLAGLRTGGVRSASTPLPKAPHTAAPGGSFNASRLNPSNVNHCYPDEGGDELGDMPSNAFATNGVTRQIPLTAAVDGPNNRFSQHQTNNVPVDPHCVPFSSYSHAAQSHNPQVQAHAMQLMQLQLMHLQGLQALQAQNYQLELMNLQSQQNPVRRASPNPPATSGPLKQGFDLRSATLRRVSQAESQVEGGGWRPPMSAAIDGKFASRDPYIPSAEEAIALINEDVLLEFPRHSTPTTSSQTSVISGGTPLGTPSNAKFDSVPSTPSKSDSATSWRRAGNNKSVLSGNRTVSASMSPSVKITPPPTERVSPPPSLTATKARPIPLRFSAAASQPLPAVTIDNCADCADESSSSSASSKCESATSAPTTPESESPSNDGPLSPREEAAKKLYEGLGIGRPASTTVPTNGPTVVSHRMASQPLRQPRGPPSGMEELGPRNFATRIRRKAIGGLGPLMDARERREAVEAF